MRAFRRLIEAIDAEGSAALVTLTRVQGSSPREEGARLIVRPSGGFHGTICGGPLEWQIETFDRRDAAELAKLAAAEEGSHAWVEAQMDGEGRVERMVGLGPASASWASAGRWTEPVGEGARPVYLFGAGHVGRALTLALGPLPFTVRWIDSRPDAFPAYAPANVVKVHSPAPPAELAGAPEGALVVIMTHSHPLDLEIVAEALRLEKFGFVGLIGSATKRARFLSQMRAAGLSEAMLAKLVCPIGIKGVVGKEPAVIAASTAAQLLSVSQAGL